MRAIAGSIVLLAGAVLGGAAATADHNLVFPAYAVGVIHMIVGWVLLIAHWGSAKRDSGTSDP